jgi:precorrin-2 dehydrogenase/sirohydrochlorin ferrochelatase
MLVDLKFEGKYVVVVGGGSESYRKTLDFLEAGAKISVVSRSFSTGFKQLVGQWKISLQKAEIEDIVAFFGSLKPKPDLLVAVTNDYNLNAQLIRQAKSAGCMVYAPDNPSISDFMLPAIAKVGNVRIAISTSGKSPAMASVLRQRIEKMITQEDLLQVKLQDYVRGILKEQVSDQKVRRELLYSILENAEIKKLLKQSKFEEAKESATKILANTYSKNSGNKIPPV